MKQGKYAAPVRRRRRRNTLKPMLIAMAVVLLLGCVTGGTLAWLTSTTGEVVNTFTVGDINIELKETWNLDTDDDNENDSWQGKMIPGHTITKDPKVTVTSGSEDCYLFVKIDKSTSLDDYIAYAIDSGWTKLTEVDGVDNVWYRVIDDETKKGIDYSVLAGDSLESGYSWSENQVLVKPTVTKQMMNDLKVQGAVQPTLTFQAAAVQLKKNNDTNFTLAEAYAQVWPTTTP